jgi:hypothetical protein
MEIDEEAGVLRYTPHTISKFDPGRSIADPKDVFVNMPNIAMLVRLSPNHQNICTKND